MNINHINNNSKNIEYNRKIRVSTEVNAGGLR